MFKSTTAKVVAGLLIALTLVVAVPANAQTAAELQAQINSLMATIAALQSQLGGVSTPASTFTLNLTVGSKGAEVTALQNKLNVVPATGYFGPITKAAVISYQLEKGLPGTGYVGPLTRAALNAGAPVVVPPPTTTTGGVTTTGQEGTLSVTQSNAGLPSTIYEGDSMVGVLSFKVEAKNSDIAIQRVKLDLGTGTAIYNKRFEKIYVTEGSNVLASSDLNSSTVVKDGTTYYITLTGMNLVIPKDGSKVLTVKVDVRSSVDSTYRGSTYASTFRLAGTADGVRGVDGAGINQYAGGTTVTRTISTISTDLVDSASLKLSTDSNTVKSTQIIASSGTNNDEADKVEVLKFDLKAEKDNVLVTDLTTTIAGTAEDNGNVTTAYLYDGSTEVSNSSITAGVASFDSIDLTVAKDSTKVLTIKVDIRNATGTKTVTASVATSDITAENSNGDAVTGGSLTGSASSNTITVTQSGANIALISKTTEKSVVTDTGVSTSTLSAKFTYRVTADGADVVLGTTGSSTMAFASSSAFTVYKNGAVIAQSAAPTISAVSFEMPDSGVVDNGNNTFTIADGNSADILVTVTLQTTTTGNTFSIQTAALNVNNTLITFMNGQSAWRTTSVILP